MNRREFLQTMATRTAAATAFGLAAGCAAQEAGVAPQAPEAVAQDSSLPELTWDMPTSWPTALDTIFGGATSFADRSHCFVLLRWQEPGDSLWHSVALWLECAAAERLAL